MKTRILAWILTFLPAVAAVAAVSRTVLKNEAVQGSDEFQFTYAAKLPALTGPARVWMPLARSDAFQTVRVEEISAPIAHRQVRDRDFGNQVLVLDVGPAQAGKTVTVKYSVRREEKAAYRVSEKDLARYLKAERLVPAKESFKTIAASVTKGKKNALEKGRSLYDHVLGRMKYDKSGTGWGRGDAQYACDVRAGNCTDFHAYFIALARSVGLPARFAIGYTIPAVQDEGTIPGYHCWAEFEADGKWIPVDISEASKHPELAEYYFGHHPANRFELTSGRDLVVDPAPNASPINFLIYPLLEIEGKQVPTENLFSFRRVK